MLDMYLDMMCTVKGIWYNDRDREAVDMKQMVTWEVVMEGMSTIFFVNRTFKRIDGYVRLIDADGVALDDVFPPRYSEITEEGDTPCAGLITTGTLIFVPSKYVEMKFDWICFDYLLFAL